MGPARWPEVVVIGSPSADNALAELFAHLPDDARVFLAGVDNVDAALAAEILLAADRNLEPYQRDALANFIAAERKRVGTAPPFAASRFRGKMNLSPAQTRGDTESGSGRR